MKVQASSTRGILFFLLIVCLFSIPFWALILLDKFRSLYTTGLMWSPGIAALLACKLTGKPLDELGWWWGPRKYALLAYLAPFFYTLAAYLVVWLTGMGGFYDADFEAAVVAAYNWESISPSLTVMFYLLLTATLGMVQSLSMALGEEIGWRGFLVPALATHHSFIKVSLVSGAIWAIWHYPLIIFGNYNASVDRLYALLCFTVMILGLSFLYSWFRLKSNSLWPAVILHASHNLFVQRIFTPLTSNTGITPYIIDEFGIALALVGIVIAIAVWRRSRVEVWIT